MKKFLFMALLAFSLVGCMPPEGSNVNDGDFVDMDDSYVLMGKVKGDNGDTVNVGYITLYKGYFKGHTYYKHNGAELIHDPDCELCLQRQREMIKEAIENRPSASTYSSKWDDISW